jgi:putative hydrolase of HD superfamily
MKKYAESSIELGKLALLFAHVNRATYHMDCTNQESDSDHTVMLALVACSFADVFYKDKLDNGKVAQFAIVHDLVEAYSGDTNSIGLTAETKKQKDEREHEALLRIKSEFDGVFPWISKTIEEYESLSSPEAKFVKLLDKAMPKIVNILSDGEGLKREKRTKEEMTTFFNEQFVSLSKEYGTLFPEAIAMTKILMDSMLEQLYEIH